MNDRIQRVLDGELQREALNPGETWVLGETESMIAAVVQSVPAQQLPDLGPAVLRRLEAEGQVSPRPSIADKQRASSQLRRILDWIWTPRPLAIGWRPAYAVPLVILLMLAGLRTTRTPTSEPGPEQVLVQFRLDAPQARQVMLAGDFTRWQPLYALKRSEPGIWTVVVPLATGVHDYSFIVDGERWVPDPMAPAVSDGFGGLNSRLAVLLPDRRPRS